ncbi:unnamed protein product, partial [Nippostrongylus brasiliensis]|uniref:SH3KBP1 n=1 Tax=Nippostrongylus brasiliensis TaxID=27835 RepID=A0A0N4YJV3_NIPBR
EPHLPSSGSRSRAAPVETPQNSSAVFEPSQLLKKLAPLKDPAELLSDSAGRSPKCEPKKDSPRQISPGTMYKPIAPPRPSAPSSKSPSSLTGSSTSSSVDSVSYADVHVQCENVQAVLTPTMIEILPSPESTLSRPNRAENESDTATRDEWRSLSFPTGPTKALWGVCSSLPNSGVGGLEEEWASKSGVGRVSREPSNSPDAKSNRLATFPGYSTVLDVWAMTSNSRSDPPVVSDLQRMSGSYLLTVPGSDYSIVVNHL